MQEPLGLLIAAARRRIKQAVTTRLAGHDLSAQQFWFLVAIAEEPGISQSKVAHRVRADAPTASRVFAGMVRRGLVRTAEDPQDRRRIRAWLTPEGERLARQLAPVAEEVRDAVVSGMSRHEVEAVRAGLRRIIENLDALDAAAPRRRRA
jgi:DNA-binding MarR family transcriptional regulator